jgi:hypothetical protein
MEWKRWSDKTPEEQFKAICWSVATSSAIETGQNPMDIYERLLNRTLNTTVNFKEKLD